VQRIFAAGVLDGRAAVLVIERSGGCHGVNTRSARVCASFPSCTKGVRFFGDGIRTSSVVMQTAPAVVRFIDTIHVESNRTISVRF
jgi:hypothetical protein